jgi:hypothetical protein
MSSSSKRQQTMAKRAREHSVKERRALKAEKKLAARMAKAAGLDPSQDVPAPEGDEPAEQDSPTP